MKKILRKKITTPFLLSVPHAGNFYPKLFIKNKSIDLKLLRLMEDYKSDLLIEKIDYNLADIIIAKCSRSVVDLNRSKHSIDSNMFENNIKHVPSTEALLIKSGLGLFPKKCYQHKIFDRKLTCDYANKIIKNFYEPYHKIISDRIKFYIKEFGYAVLIDIHSTPSFSNSNNFCLSDIILGDNFGKSCSSNLRNFIFNYFKKNKLSVAINSPYAGGFITRNYGKKNKNINVIQIEINKKLYMNEKTFAINNNILNLQKLLKDMLSELSDMNKIAAQ